MDQVPSTLTMDETHVNYKVASWLTSLNNHLDANPVNSYELLPHLLALSPTSEQNSLHVQNEQSTSNTRRGENRYTPYDIRGAQHSRPRTPPLPIQEEQYEPPAPPSPMYILPPPPAPPVLPPISDVLRLPPPPVPPICNSFITVETHELQQEEEQQEEDRASTPRTIRSSPESPNSFSWFYDPLYYWLEKDRKLKEERARLEAEATAAAAGGEENKIEEENIAGKDETTQENVLCTAEINECDHKPISVNSTESSEKTEDKISEEAVTQLEVGIEVAEHKVATAISAH